MNEEEQPASELNRIIDKAEESLSSALNEFDEGRYGFASSQAYYTVFHAMTAALYAVGKTYSKHAGVIAGFNELFIKTGKMPKAFGAVIQRLRKDRETGDYSYDVKIDKETAESGINDAERILSTIKDYLKL
jgi:uncharacterized protein (UPF0332 family)